MATISKTGIQDGLTSKAEHITRIIDALDGTATTEVVATGSFTGSFDGIYTGTVVSASYAVTAGTVVSASYAVTASHALNGGGGGSGIFVQTGSYYATTNNLQITGSVILNGQVATKGNGVITFSGSRGVIMPGALLTNAEEVNLSFTSLPAGGYVFVDLSDTGAVTLTLPTANDAFVGYAYNIGLSAVGGSGDMQIAGGASKIFGNIAAQANQKNFNAASTLTIDSGNSRVGDTLTIRGMGEKGWLLTGTFRDGSTIT
jgi:hypothetical protein|tara:strand:- start:886 stop:1662 length:777 start_codon:yes stop_codon:yes gene_type:complete